MIFAGELVLLVAAVVGCVLAIGWVVDRRAARARRPPTYRDFHLPGR